MYYTYDIYMHFFQRGNFNYFISLYVEIWLKSEMNVVKTDLPFVNLIFTSLIEITTLQQVNVIFQIPFGTWLKVFSSCDKSITNTSADYSTFIKLILQLVILQKILVI